MQAPQFRSIVLLVLVLLMQLRCTRRQVESQSDAPRLTPGVYMQDIVFRSSALGRDMRYRVILPKTPQGKIPVVYLLHGGGGGFRDWSNFSDVAAYAEKGLILVMPEGDDSYYTNAAARPQDRYEDYILNDLISDVEARFPAARERSPRAIVGVSMGGFGAIKIALKRPELFSFAAGISPAIDVPTRPFSIKRIRQWQHHRSIFGEWRGAFQTQNDPYSLARTNNPSKAAYMYLSCGDQEGLLPAVRQFATLLSEHHFRYEFHVIRGGHNWVQWNATLPECFKALLEHVS